MTQSALSWIRRKPVELLQVDQIPLTGNVPPFPWDHLSEQMLGTFELQSCHLVPGQIEWRASGEWFEGMSRPLKTLVFSLSSLQGKFYFSLPEPELALLLSLLLTHSADPLDLEESEYLDGFFRFFALEVLHFLQQTPFLGGVTPVLLPEEQTPESAALAIDVQCQIDGRPLQGRILFTPKLLESWKQHRSEEGFSLRGQQIAEEAQIEVHLQVGHLFLKLDEWKEVQKGDFVPLQTCSLEPSFTKGRILLTIDNQPIFRAKLKDGSLKILEYPIFHEEQTMTPFEEEEEEEEEQEEENEESWSEEEEELPEEEEEEGLPEEEVEEQEQQEELKLSRGAVPVKPEEIPLSLAIEVGRLRMSIAQLLHLEPGNLLNLNIHPENGVDLTINGKCVGKGELIQLGETLGVRITDIG